MDAKDLLLEDALTTAIDLEKENHVLRVAVFVLSFLICILAWRKNG